MKELVSQIQYLKTLPAAIDKILPRLRALYRQNDLHGMVQLLNTHKYATGREYQIVTQELNSLTVIWVKR